VQYDRAEGVISLARRHCRSATGRIALAVSAIVRAVTAIARAVTAIARAVTAISPAFATLQAVPTQNMVQRTALASYTESLICLRNPKVLDGS
jgi:hypothetical protein